MKLLIMLLPFALHLTACGFDAVEHKTDKPILQKHLVVLVYDISASVDMVAVLRSAHFEMLYDNLGRNGGGKVYGLHIKTNSRKQEPFLATVSGLEQLPMKGNPYQRANRIRMNEQLQVAFEQGKVAFVTSFEKLMVPKTESFSDVENALELAKQISEMSACKTWIKHIVIISDLENDLPPVNGMDKMSPIAFDKNVEISIVRPSKRVDLVQIFPGVRFSVYSTIDDAIQSMFHSHD